MPLAISGAAGVGFSHVGRAASLNPLWCQGQGSSRGYSAASMSPFQLCPITEPCHSGSSCLHLLPARLVRLGEGRERAGHGGLTRDVSPSLIFLAA